MKTVSPNAFAAMLVLVKLFTLSMYVPADGENPALTAVIFGVFSILKLISFIPLFVYLKNAPEQSDRSKLFSSVRAVFYALSSAVLALAAADALATAIESVYPDRYTKLGINAVIFFICAYIASMGIKAITRCSSLILFTVLALMLFVFYQLRGSIIYDRINLYADEPLGMIFSTLKNLMIYLVDYLLFFALLPYVKGKPSKAAGIYISTNIIITITVLLTSAAVMGSFWDNSGYVFFTLSFATFGSVVDRSDGMFLAVSTASGLICISALLTVLKDSLQYFFSRVNEQNILLFSAAGLTSLLLLADNLNFEPEHMSYGANLIIFTVLFAGSCIGAILAVKKGGEKGADIS